MGLHEPLVGESMPKLVRMQPGKACLRATAPKHLYQPPLSQPPFQSQPQPWEVDVVVTRART
jgi:hypothetical protein